MKISGDNRVISHFYRDEKSAVYTILYPPSHTLKERCEILDELVLDMKMALKEEDRLREEHKASESKLTFEEWIKEKQKKAQEEQAAKAVPVEEVPNAEKIEEAKIVE